MKKYYRSKYDNTFMVVIDGNWRNTLLKTFSSSAAKRGWTGNDCPFYLGYKHILQLRRDWIEVDKFEFYDAYAVFSKEFLNHLL